MASRGHDQVEIRNGEIKTLRILLGAVTPGAGYRASQLRRSMMVRGS